MGIRHLNKFFRENCKPSIRLASLSELSGKKIAVDISIYLYKYASEGTLIESMYLMLSILRYHGVIPLFIFDVKPPDEKKKLLQKRKEDKKEAEKEYHSLKNSLEAKTEVDEEEKQEILAHMDMLKKKFVYIHKNQIDDIKQLITSYGMSYFDAEGEADELCALLTVQGKVWACLSEDMDMFVYGCTRVLRYMSLLNHSVVLYDIKGILQNLGITQNELREICVLSGTDYNFHVNPKGKTTCDLYQTLKYFKKYHKQKKGTENLCFYDWLKTNTSYIEDSVLIDKITGMFDLSDKKLEKGFEKDCFANQRIVFTEMKEILRKDGFLFA
jgi:5'-3' exonuclease